MVVSGVFLLRGSAGFVDEWMCWARRASRDCGLVDYRRFALEDHFDNISLFTRPLLFCPPVFHEVGGEVSMVCLRLDAPTLRDTTMVMEERPKMRLEMISRKARAKPQTPKNKRAN